MIKIFLELVEIKTKLASILPFTFATLFVIYKSENFNILAFVYMLVSLLFFDLSTTAINNYMDYVKAIDDDYKNNFNVIGKNNLSINLIKAIILSMLIVAIFFGILLVNITNITVLFLGVFCFLVGILYTWGPIPISRLPLGEIFSGFVQGFILIYIAVYIHNPSILNFTFINGIVNINFSLFNQIEIFVVSIPFVLSISNIMLANNVCDFETDIKNNRFLLPYFIGIKNSLVIFNVSYYAIYGSIIVSVLIGSLPGVSLFSLLSIPIVYKNMKIFNERQIKSETFDTSVKNLAIISVFYILPLIIYLIFF